MDAYPTIFSSPHLNASTALDSFVANKKLISPLAIEGLHQIGNSFSNLRLYHSLGVRYATLTHNCHNAFADAAIITNSSGATIAAPPYWGGVSNRGRDVVREMNRLGMLVDLAHVSKDTMLDVLGGRPKKWEAPRQSCSATAPPMGCVHTHEMYLTTFCSSSKRQILSS